MSSGPALPTGAAGDAAVSSLEDMRGSSVPSCAVFNMLSAKHTVRIDKRGDCDQNADGKEQRRVEADYRARYTTEGLRKLMRMSPGGLRPLIADRRGVRAHRCKVQRSCAGCASHKPPRQVWHRFSTQRR